MNNASAQKARVNWLKKLEDEIHLTSKYDEIKIARIDSIRNISTELKYRDLFQHYLVLYKEYAFFNFDSAYFYADKMKEVAIHLKDSLLEKYATIKINTVLLSSGMF